MKANKPKANSQQKRKNKKPKKSESVDYGSSYVPEESWIRNYRSGWCDDEVHKRLWYGGDNIFINSTKPW